MIDKTKLICTGRRVVALLPGPPFVTLSLYRGQLSNSLSCRGEYNDKQLYTYKCQANNCSIRLRAHFKAEPLLVLPWSVLAKLVIFEPVLVYKLGSLNDMLTASPACEGMM